MRTSPSASTLKPVTHRLPTAEGLDRIVAACVLVTAELATWVGNSTPGWPKGLATPVIALMAASVAVRRRAPLAAGCVVVLGVSSIFLAGGNNYSVPLFIAWACGLYAIAVWTETREFVIGLAVMAGSNLLAAAGPVTKFGDAAFFTVVPAIAMVITRRAVRDRQVLADTMAARADLAEREQELRAHEAVADERARIARELHDLVAHNVSVMVVQAGVERHALGDDQKSTRDTLASIEQAGRQALVEARRLLGVLRRDDTPEELEPQPSVERIGTLVEQVERAGLPVELTVEGERVPLPPGVDLCAYRIIQEGLTNALKHAGPARAEVVLRYAQAGLDIEVADNGRGPAAVNGHGAGHGLIGMRERVRVHGGALEAGPRPGGGFEVRARLPLRREEVQVA